MRRLAGLLAISVVAAGGVFAGLAVGDTGAHAGCGSTSTHNETGKSRKTVTVPASSDKGCPPKGSTEKQTAPGRTEGAPGVPTQTGTTVTTTPPPNSPPGLANLWVGNAGTCPYSATPVSYNPATACSTMQAALAAAPLSGATVRLHCGSYAPQTLTTSRKSGTTTFASEAGRCASINANGGAAVTLGNGVSYVTLDSLTVNGLVRGSIATGIGNNHVTVSNNSIDVDQKVDGPLVQFSVGDYIAITGNVIGPSCCGYNGGNGVTPNGIRIGKPNSAVASCTTQVCHLTITDNLIQYTVRDCALWPSGGHGACPDTSCSNAAGCHADGIQIWGVDGATISRNRLYGVECQAIFFEISNNSLNRNVAVIGNAISTVAGGCGNKGIYIRASGSTNGSTDGFAGAWTIAFNSGGGTLIGPNGCGQCWPSTTFTLVGNAMPLFVTDTAGNNAGCTAWGPATVTYLYNVWQLGGTGKACGATDTVAATPFVSNAFAPATGIDLHLNGAPTPADTFVPAAECALAPIDIDGNARTVNGACAAGAFRR